MIRNICTTKQQYNHIQYSNEVPRQLQLNKYICSHPLDASTDLTEAFATSLGSIRLIR